MPGILNVGLRPYQERAIAAVRSSYASGRRAPCLVLPTGSGKTRCAAAMIGAAVARGRRVLFGAHRTELIDQTVDKLADAGVHDVRIIQAERDVGSATAAVIVGSIQTLTTDRWIGALPKVDLVIIDEAHHTVCESWQRVVQAHPGARLLGLTATPQRGDGRPLGDLFDDLVVGATVRELVELEHLVPCRVWAPAEQLDTGKLAIDPVAAYREHANNQRAIVFAASRRHAAEILESFRAAGIATDLVTGVGPKDARRAALGRFASGETSVLCNVNVLTEGYDCPAAAVCILARRAVHVGTYLQMVGRVLRPSPGKTGAVLVDLTGAVHEHGTPDVDREYSLTGQAIRASAIRDAIQQCRSCGSVFLAAATCPHCGADMPPRARRAPRSVGVGVVDVTDMKPAKPRTWIVKMLAKRGGTCRKCGSWFPAGTEILWAKGRAPQHNSCPPPNAEVRHGG